MIERTNKRTNDRSFETETETETESAVVVIARTDPNEQESVVLLPELDKIHTTW